MTRRADLKVGHYVKADDAAKTGRRDDGVMIRGRYWVLVLGGGAIGRADGGRVDLAASGSIALNVFGFVLAGGGFDIKKGQVSGTDGTTTLSNAQALTIELTSASLFVGVGGAFNAGTTTLDTSSAVGFSATTMLKTAPVWRQA